MNRACSVSGFVWMSEKLVSIFASSYQWCDSFQYRLHLPAGSRIPRCVTVCLISKPGTVPRWRKTTSLRKTIHPQPSHSADIQPNLSSSSFRFSLIFPPFCSMYLPPRGREIFPQLPTHGADGKVSSCRISCFDAAVYARMSICRV